jgi:hypothetical protein
MKRLVLLIAVAVMSTACSSSTGSTPSSAKPTTTASPSSAKPTTTASPTAPAPRATLHAVNTSAPAATACSSAQLRLTLATLGAAAGTYYQSLRFINVGSATCSLRGTPDIAFVAPGTGTQIGVATGTDGDGPLVEVAPGGDAAARVGIGTTGNFSLAVCRPTTTSGIRVYPPGERKALYIPFPAGDEQVCAGDVAPSRQLTVGPVVAGPTGQ